jgi:vacuolar protein sorting-associated protein 18
LEDSTGTSTNAAAEPNNTEYRSVVNEFRAFLSDSEDVLDEATTMRLLERYVVLHLSFMVQLSPHTKAWA